jgi:hypothetical protein
MSYQSTRGGDYVDLVVLDGDAGPAGRSPGDPGLGSATTVSHYHGGTRETNGVSIHGNPSCEWCQMRYHFKKYIDKGIRAGCGKRQYLWIPVSPSS